MIAGKRCKQIIVRFTSFRYRSMLYKARKNATKFQIYLDLTKQRKDLLDQANAYISNQNIQNCFAFADLNCRLCLKRDEHFSYFTTYNGLMELVNNSNN